MMNCEADKALMRRYAAVQTECDGQAVAVVEAICVHEHHSARSLCHEHAIEVKRRLDSGRRPFCERCRLSGHDVTLTVRWQTPPVDDPSVTVS